MQTHDGLEQISGTFQLPLLLLKGSLTLKEHLFSPERIILLPIVNPNLIQTVFRVSFFYKTVNKID